MKKIFITLIILVFTVAGYNLLAQEKEETVKIPEKISGIKTQTTKSQVQNTSVSIRNLKNNEENNKIISPDGPRVIKTSTGNNWGIANNWSPRGVPSINDDVIINSNMTCNPGNGYMFQCASLTINSGRTLTIRPSQLNVTGNVTNNGTLILYIGTSTYTTYFTCKGNFTNNGSINATADYSELRFDGTSAQTFTNNGTVTAPMKTLSVANSSGLTLSGSNQIVLERINLFYGTVTNSNLIKLGNGGSTTGVVQRGSGEETPTNPAGSFDRSPLFNAGDGGIQLLYTNASADYLTSFEVPEDGIVAYLLVNSSSRTITITQDITVDYVYYNSLNLLSGNLSIDDNTLYIYGEIIQTSGTLTGGTTSDVFFIGYTSTTLPAVINGLDNLSIYNDAGIVIGGAVTTNRVNLFNGVFTNSNLITIGRGGTTSAVVQRGSAGETFDYTAGSFDREPVFDDGTGGVELLYANAIDNYSTSFEVPVDYIISYLSLNSYAKTITMNSDIIIDYVYTTGLNLNSGNLSIGTNTLTINGLIGITSGTLTGGTTSNIIIGGTTTPSTILPSITLQNFELDRAAGVTIAGDMTISNLLTLTNGILNTKNGTTLNTIYFTSTAIPFTHNEETSASRIVGKAVMNERNVQSPNPLSFLGVSLQGTNENISFTIERISGVPESIVSYGGYSGIACRWHVQTSEIPTIERNVTYYWLSDLDNGKDFNSYDAQVWISEDGSNWLSSGLAIPVPTNPRSVQVQTTTFSFWTASSSDSPLPIKLASFISAITGRDIKLSWVTESEENNSGFDIEKSTVNSEQPNWQKTGFVAGKGTKNTPTNYTFEEKNLQTGKYKYRLKQIDYNGNYEYFELNNIIEIGVPAKFDLSQNYPNPFNPVTKINFDIPESGLVTMKVYDMLGKEVLTVMNNEIKDAGYHTVTFDASKLSSGVYFYRLSANGFSSVKRMVVLK